MKTCDFLLKNFVILIICALITSSCTTKTEGPPNPDTGLTEQQISDEVDRLFPFTPNQPFEAIYQCGRLGSVLTWYFYFQENGVLQVAFTTDTGDDYVFDGNYNYTNNEIRLMMPSGPNMPFPQGLDEITTAIMPQFGLVAAFSTENMICICDGHNLNQQAPPKVRANYDCPIINIQAVSDEDNAIEFVHTEVPFSIPVPGSIFRQQDTYVSGLTNPLIRRGFGIYRQNGNRFYATFRIANDFAQFANGALPFSFNPAPPFEDFNLISGEFRNNGLEIIVDQLKPDEGACSLR